MTTAMKRYSCVTILIGLLTSCLSASSNPSKLDSDNYERKSDRINKLKAEIKSFSDFQDADFELFNVNGFYNQNMLTPGASSLDYKFVVRIDTINIAKWTNGMTKVSLQGYDDSWTKEITKHRSQNWKIYSKPQYYQRVEENVTLIVYKNEGILFKRVINL